MTKKACKKCKIIVEGNECPVCKGKDFSETLKGRIYIFDTGSQIAQKLNFKLKGEYTIKT